VPLYLHPTFPPRAVADVYYSDLDEAVAGPLLTAAWGWHDETGLHVLLQCALALAVVGADRMLFSVDYPWGGPSLHAQFLNQAPISPADRQKIGHLNGERLFRL
jgi:predicted TIM-barrel fold metal-dependent hydrolase